MDLTGLVRQIGSGGVGTCGADANEGGIADDADLVPIFQAAFAAQP